MTKKSMRLKAQLSQEPRTMHKSRPISSGESCEYEILHHSSLSVYVLVCVCVHVLNCFSRVWLFLMLYTVACQTPLSMGFCKQEYWSGLPCPPLEIFPTQGSNLHFLGLLHCQANSLPPAPLGKSLRFSKFRNYQKWKIWSCNLNLLNHILFEWGWH